MATNVATRILIGDDDISLESMNLRGVFSIAPEIGYSGRKGKLAYFVKCYYPAFADTMFVAAVMFTQKNGGAVSPRNRKTAPMDFVLRFDAPPRNETYATRFVLLASGLFLELRNVFGDWQVQDHFRQVIKDAIPKRPTKPLRIVRRRCCG